MMYNRMKSFSSIIFLIFLMVSASFPCLTRATANSPKAADLVSDNQPVDLSSKRYDLFFRELREQHQFDERYLQQLFAGLQLDRRVLQLMDKQWEAKPYYQYRRLFITSKTIAKGRWHLAEHKSLFDHIETIYGVDREVIVAIWGIESRFGANQGTFGTFRTLNTLFDAYPRRSEFFRNELIHFLVLCRANNIDPRSVKGSYAGAFGQAQFMPSSFNRYAVDFDGDNHRDLINSEADIFASIANYLHTFGWILNGPIYTDLGNTLNSEQLISVNAKGRMGRIDRLLVNKAQNLDIPPSPGNHKLSIIGLQRSPTEGGGKRYIAGYPNFHAITEYNHSNRYAMAVSELAEAFRN